MAKSFSSNDGDHLYLPFKNEVLLLHDDDILICIEYIIPHILFVILDIGHG